MTLAFPSPTPQATLTGSIYLQEHFSSAYTGRTLQNVKSADLTCACAADYSSPGERLTEKLATDISKDKYLRLPLYLTPAEASTRLVERLHQTGFRSLNIAGNGIHTLHKKNWTQAQVDEWLEEVIYLTLESQPIDFMVSGGQTGLDMSGAICAARFNIPAIITFPKGFIQRNEKGFDKPQKPEDIAQWIEREALRLKNRRNPARIIGF